MVFQHVFISKSAPEPTDAESSPWCKFHQMNGVGDPLPDMSMGSQREKAPLCNLVISNGGTKTRVPNIMSWVSRCSPTPLLVPTKCFQKVGFCKVITAIFLTSPFLSNSIKSLFFNVVIKRKRIDSERRQKIKTSGKYHNEC